MRNLRSGSLSQIWRIFANKRAKSHPTVVGLAAAAVGVGCGPLLAPERDIAGRKDREAAAQLVGSETSS